jgi:porin
MVAMAAAAQNVAGQPDASAAGPDIWERPGLLGDPFHLHDWMAEAGLSVDLTLLNEVLRNTSGGYERTTHSQTQAILGVSLDTAPWGWDGGRFYASGFAISGFGLTIDGVGSLATISGVEAEHALRLFDLWFEQSFFGGRLSIRFGQQGADEEFLLNSGAEVFVDGDFGWPTLASIDLPSGGANYPLATPAVRIKWQPNSQFALLAAVFNGNPSPDGFGDPQQTNRNGLDFRLDGGAFPIIEVQYTPVLNVFGMRLPAAYKLGAWYNTNRFLDQHRDAQGLSLANFNSTGFPAVHQGNWSIYGSVEQALWRGGGDSERGATLVLRLMSAPDDRNQVSMEADGGLLLHGLLPGRADDTFGLGFSWSKIGQAARGLDADLVALGLNRPVRSAEGLIEATYQARLTPWLQMQPDLQYIIRPGGGVPGGGGNISRPLGNSLIIGLRTVVKF